MGFVGDGLGATRQSGHEQSGNSEGTQQTQDGTANRNIVWLPPFAIMVNKALAKR